MNILWWAGQSRESQVLVQERLNIGGLGMVSRHEESAHLANLVNRDQQM